MRRIVGVAFTLVSTFVSSFAPGAGKQNNRQPTSGGGHRSPWRYHLLTSALAEISSSKTLVLEKAPLRPQRSVAVPHPGQLLMMQTLLTYISPTSSRGHFATT